MGVITAKQLKQRTGEVIKRVKSGEKLTLTHRGKPIATIVPATEHQNGTLEGLRSFEEAWKDIEETLQRTAPEHKGWKEAVDWIRNRNRF